MPEEITLAELRRFDTTHEANLAVSVLEAAGIESMIRNSFVAGANPELGIVSGGVTILVRSDELDEAREVLDQGAKESGGAAEAATSWRELRCAECDGPLQSAMAACPQCDALPAREVMTPKRTKLAIVQLKLWVLGVTLALIAAPIVGKRLWDSFIQLPEQTIVTGVWGLFALIAGFLLIRALAGSDRRA